MIHQHINGLTPAEVSTLDPVILTEAGQALAVMNSIAVACDAGLAEKELVGRVMGRSFASTVTAARPFIDSTELRRGYRPYRYAEELAEYFLLATGE